MDNSVEKVDNALIRRCGGLGIFAKAPVPGQVKTRLCPPLTETEAAVFSHLALVDVSGRMRTDSFEPFIFSAGDETYFRRHFSGMSMVPQGDGGLGERMERALRHLLASHQTAVLIGSDAPDLPLATVLRAFLLLEQHDFVTAPAADGGYVLVGCRRPCPKMFEKIAWSTPEVLTVTRQRAATLGIAYAEVPGWEDVDDLGSLQRLLHRSRTLKSSRYAARRLSRRSGGIRRQAAALGGYRPGG